MQQMMMQQQGGAQPSAGGGYGQAKVAIPLKKKKEEDKGNIVFVGGLRKSTTEDKVTAHFAKYGQVDNVDIKRLPDGTSRGFAFVKFIEVDAIEKVLEAQASHMIDNKWVAVKPHGGTAFNEGKNEARAKETSDMARASKKKDDGPENTDEY
ncbi:unnamed protein product, partial [Polarella glacialis]